MGLQCLVITITWQPLFVPTFTVTVSKPVSSSVCLSEVLNTSVTQGTSVQFDCSFDECGSYEEQGSEWECMHIDSVTVLPDDSGAMENIYSVDAENLNEVIHYTFH